MATMFTGGGRYALDVPVAAFAGLSVAFLVFAMPGDLLAELIGSTGLASLVPAAEAPYGMKARIGIGAAGAVAVFAAAFLTLRLLDRLGARPAEEEESSARMEAPRLRRRDFHPDAPPRPPIMATCEFGEPETVPPAPVEAPEPAAHEAEYASPPSVESPEAAPREAEEWLLDQLAAFEDAPADPFPSPAPEAPAAAPDLPSTHDLPGPSGSLDELMARLEQGLARRRVEAQAPETAPVEPPAQPQPQPFPEAADDRLQSAIDSLQRLAAQRD